MKTLEQVKDEVAKENGLGKLVTGLLVKHFDEVARRYARQVAEKALADAAENANIEYYPCGYWVSKDSILNTEIILP